MANPKDEPTALPMFGGREILTMTVRSDHIDRYQLIDTETGRRWKTTTRSIPGGAWTWREAAPNER